MSTIDRQAIIETLSRLVTPGIKLTALADELGARKPQYASLRELILDLVEDGTVQVLPGGAFALAPSGRPGDPGAKPVPASRPAPARPAKQSKPPATKQARPTPRTPWSAPARPHKPRRDGDGAHAGRALYRPPPSPPREQYDPETGEVHPVEPAPESSRPA